MGKEEFDLILYYLVGTYYILNCTNKINSS